MKIRKSKFEEEIEETWLAGISKSAPSSETIRLAIRQQEAYWYGHGEVKVTTYFTDLLLKRIEALEARIAILEKKGTK